MATHNGPESRLAQYLAKIAGEDVPTPKPSTEAEIYLNKIAESGGSGGGGGVFVVRITSPDGGKTYTSDKTADDIVNALKAGAFVVAYAGSFGAEEGACSGFIPILVSWNSDGSEVCFQGIKVNDKVAETQFIITNDGVTKDSWAYPDQS